MVILGTHDLLQVLQLWSLHHLQDEVPLLDAHLSLARPGLRIRVEQSIEVGLRRAHAVGLNQLASMADAH